MEPTDIAWAAGIVDGEGCIRTTRHRHRALSVELTVTNTDPRMLFKLRELFGGNICQQRKASEKGRATWCWRVHCENAICILETLLPFLIVKRDQASLAISFRQLRRQRGGRIGDKDVRIANEALYEKQCWLDRQLRQMKREVFSVSGASTTGGV